MKNAACMFLALVMMLVTAFQGAELKAAGVGESSETTIAVAAGEIAPELTPARVALEEAAGEEPTAEAGRFQDTPDGNGDEDVALMATLAPPPQLSSRELGVHPAPCWPELSMGAGLVEGEDYTCGLFTVSQNWDEPDGRNLDLGFVVVHASGENPAPDPLLFLAGGPGASGVLGADIGKYRTLRADRDIILFDIRGAGVSQRLGFAECLVLALQNEAPPEEIEALRAPNAGLLRAVDDGRAPEELKPSELEFPRLNEICWEQFTSQGFDLNQFSTASNARDAVELVSALGYESFNVHSVSYGTRLAMTIMDALPGYDEAPALRAVILDSTFPPSVYLVRTIVRSDHDFMLQLLDECQADASCSAAYPNLKARLAALLNKLEQAPITAAGETITLEAFVDQLTNTGNTRAAYIPKMIAEVENGVPDTYLALRDGEVGTDPVGSAPLLELDTSDPVQAFLADSLDLLSGDAALEFALYVNFALTQEEPLAVLHSVIEESASGEVGGQMLTLLGALTPEDVANSPYVQQLLADAAYETDPELMLARSRRAIIGALPRPLFSTIHCIDDIQFERVEDAVNSYNDLYFPQLTNLVESQAQADRCENWPVTAAPIEVKDPVSSTVPALVLQGAYDRPTPVYMGRRAARELAKSTYVLVPQQGHETWTRSDDCVGQIAAAFLQNPGAEVDKRCLDARRPQWALPDNGERGAGQLSAAQMMDASYSGIYDTPVTLTDGVYEGEPFMEGGASRPVVTFIDNTLTYGDLNGDGMDDAVALLVENSGGSGSFFYAGAQLNRGGEPADAGTVLLGDRIQLISMRIADGQVATEIVTQGPEEGMCCGTLKMRKTLGLQDGQLVELASEELGTVSLDDLMGTRWVLHRLNFDQPPLVATVITAEFANGTVAGAGGCNQYSAAVTSDGVQLLTVGPIAATAMACDTDLEAIEADYLTALQSATEWRFFPGQLAVGYVAADGEQGTLFFDPVDSERVDHVLE